MLNLAKVIVQLNLLAFEPWGPALLVTLPTSSTSVIPGGPAIRSEGPRVRGTGVIGMMARWSFLAFSSGPLSPNP
jgi:hypothetical protein